MRSLARTSTTIPRSRWSRFGSAFWPCRATSASTRRCCARLGADVVEVRKPEQLDGLDGLVIPGGESTTFTRLMRLYGLDEAIRALRRAGLRHLRRDDRARPRPPRPRRRRACAATPSAGRSRRSRPTSTLAGESEPLRAVFIRAPWIEEVGPGRRGAGRARRPSGARARGSLPRRRVPSGADRRHAAPRAVPRISEGGSPCPGIASGRRSSTRRAPPTRSAASSSRSSRARSSSRRRRAAATRPTTSRSQNAIEKAKSYSMPKDNIERAIAKGAGEGADGDGVRDDRLRGLRPRGRRGDRRGADRQPQPHRRRRAPRVHEARRRARHDRRGRVAVRAARRRDRAAPTGVDEDELFLAAADAGAEDVDARRRRVPGHERAREPRARCARRSRRRASRSTRPSCR